MGPGERQRGARHAICPVLRFSCVQQASEWNVSTAAVAGLDAFAQALIGPPALALTNLDVIQIE